jgi:hypothetical protein
MLEEDSSLPSTSMAHGGKFIGNDRLASPQDNVTTHQTALLRG